MSPYDYLKALRSGVANSGIRHPDDYEDGEIRPSPEDQIMETAPSQPATTPSIPTQPLQEEELLQETPSDKAVNETSRLNDLLSRYKDAQESRTNSARAAQIMRSADLMATGIAGAGAKRTPDEIFQGIEKLGQLPLQDVSEEINARPAVQKTYLSERMGDSGSDISNVAKTLIKQKFPNIKGIDNMSAADLEALGFKVGTFKDPNTQSNVKEWQQTVFEINGQPVMGRFSTLGKPPEIWDGKQYVTAPSGAKFVKPDVRTNQATGGIVQIKPNGGVNEITLPGVAPAPTEQPTLQRSSHDLYQTLNPAQRKYLTDKVEPFLRTELTDFQHQQNAADRIHGSLDAGKVLGDMPRAVQNAFAKLNGEKGMMSEADVAGYKGRQSILAKLGTYLNLNVNGQFSDADRKFLSAFADEFKNQSKKFMGENSQKYIADAGRNTGLNPKDTAVLLNLESYMPGLADAASGNNKVKIREKSTKKIKLVPKDVADKIMKSKDSDKYEVVK